MRQPCCSIVVTPCKACRGMDVFERMKFINSINSADEECTCEDRCLSFGNRQPCQQEYAKFGSHCMQPLLFVGLSSRPTYSFAFRNLVQASPPLPRRNATNDESLKAPSNRAQDTVAAYLKLLINHPTCNKDVHGERNC